MPALPISPAELAMTLKQLALDAGFELAGIARAGATQYGAAYREWIAAGKHGEMAYLGKGVEERLDVTRKFAWAKSVLCVGLAYWQENQEAGSKKQEGGGVAGKIARYAWGRDYHKVIPGKLEKVERALRMLLLPETFEARIYSDTGPVLERELAQRAGLGWVGKNTLLLHPRHGSFFLLGEMVLSLELPADGPVTDHCGTCTRCIDACPTGAITPYSVDGVKCISYQTLENRGGIPPVFHEPMREAHFLVGCDICQDVCPFNRRPLPTGEADFVAAPVTELSTGEVLGWSERDWDVATRGRAFRRTKHGMLQRNAAILEGRPIMTPDACGGSSSAPPGSAAAPG